MINLLPDKHQIIRDRQKRLRIWLALSLLTFAVITAWTGIKYYGCYHAGQTTRHLITHMSEIRQEMNTLQQAKAELDICRDRYMLLAELEQYYDFAFIIDFLSRFTPDMVYLQSLKVTSELERQTAPLAIEMPSLPPGADMFMLRQQTESDPETPRQSDAVYLQVKGTALNYEVIADYLKTLRASCFFQTVELARGSRTDGDMSPTVDFIINCTLWPTTVFSEIQHAYMQKTKNL